MESHNPIDIEVQWRCPHCGHRYAQALAVCTPNISGAEHKMIGSGSLICSNCGQMGPMQIGCAILLGMSVMAGSDGAIQVCRAASEGEEKDPKRWAWSVRHPSRN